MDRQSRILVLDVFDYSGNKKCNLYDSSLHSNGQASDVYVCTERNGWRELKFLVPSVLEGEHGSEHNYRQDYLKADYRIRLIDEEGTDWFLISEPKVSHQAFSKNVSVTAGHISQLLRTKNLGLEFSDEEGNNVGTAEQLLTTILNGTGWSVGKVATFYEKDEETIKVRSLKASSKTGAFKLITSMCDLFDAKPIFHGDSRTVDIIPMNPFSKPIDGGLPDVSQADGVIELNYGTNVSGITRTLNTENIVTKQYTYGSYGDKTSGYCGIDESFHKEYVYILTEPAYENVPCCFYPEGYSPKQFIPSETLPAGTTLVWSNLDPASMSYVWDKNAKRAYTVTDCNATVYVNDIFEILTNGQHILSGTPMASANVEIIDKQNWVSYLLDFSYYQKVGLLSDDMLQQLAKYQRLGVDLLETSYNANRDYLNTEFKLTEIIGNVNFCKLNVESVSEDSSYIVLNLDAKCPVQYRTDYSVKQRKRFLWTPATGIDEHGDSVNETASILYVVHDTDPVTWDKVFIKAFDGDKIDSQDGDEQCHISAITLWSTNGDMTLSPSVVGDSYYLFEMNNVNGLLGSAESGDEAKLAAIEATTTVVTNKHPVYFIDSSNSLPATTAEEINGYAWAWKYAYRNPDASQLYFFFGATNDNASMSNNASYLNKWVPVFFSSTPPVQDESTPAFWYNWSALSGYTQSTLYLWKNGEWIASTNKELNGNWMIDASDVIDINKTTPYDIEDIWPTFAAVYDCCKERDALYYGYNNYYTINITDDFQANVYPPDSSNDYISPTELEAGNYYFEDPFGDYRIFSTKNNLSVGSTLKYDAFNDWILQCDSNGTTTTIEVKKRPYDTVVYNIDMPNIIIIDKEHFTKLSPYEASGDIHGIVEYIRLFKILADEAYEVKLANYLAAQETIKKLEDETAKILGDTYREGWWQSEEYVDGDEEKLYTDAIDNLREVSQPEATYNVTFIDRYGANYDLEYSSSETLYHHNYADLKIMSAAHLIDTEIGVNIWAYFDKINKCYDKPWQTSVSINTKLSNISQRSFTDVLTHIANVASELKGKTTIYERAGYISTDGTLPADRLEGAIDQSKLKLLSSNSSWYTDERGNIVFISSDNMSAMMLNGNGFAIANNKDEWGNWNWRTFGTGNGFTADEIVSGFLSADRIQAKTISSNKQDENTQLALGWVEGSMLRLEDDSITSTVAAALKSGDSKDAQAFRASMIQQTSNAVSIEFEDRFSSLENDVSSAKSLTDNASNWFNFTSDGFEIRGVNEDGSQSSMYTQQTHKKYSFYVDGSEQTSVSGDGMTTDQVEVISGLRLGNLVGLIDEENNVTWVYSKK